MAEKAHEYARIRWVDLDTVYVDGKVLGALPELIAADITGKNVDLVSTYANKSDILIISYMAEWCGNCQYEAPQLKTIYEEFSQLGLESVVVMEYSSLKGALVFVNKYGLSMPVYFGKIQAKDENRRHLTQHYQLRKALADERGWGTPFHIIIEKGNLKKVGIVTGEFKSKELKLYLTEKLLTKEKIRKK